MPQKMDIFHGAVMMNVLEAASSKDIGIKHSEKKTIRIEEILIISSLKAMYLLIYLFTYFKS